jgi:AcrR family transcriptional regulator
MENSTLSRRERVRMQTLDEIKQHAIAQVTEGGPAALSLNAIARAMGMSGPAIYRYYASREALLAALVTDGYAQLTAVVQDAAKAAARRAPARRLAEVADAYRTWALANPYRYELLFSVRPAGYADPPEAIAAIQPAMHELLDAIGAIAADVSAPPPSARLAAQLERWAADEAPARSTPVLLLGVLTWTRLHGIVTLELAGVIGDMRLDAGLLVQAELDAVVATVTAEA